MEQERERGVLVDADEPGGAWLVHEEIRQYALQVFGLVENFWWGGLHFCYLHARLFLDLFSSIVLASLVVDC